MRGDDAPLDSRCFTLECLDHEALAKSPAWWDIYNASFPAEEREPPDVILNGLRQGMGMVVQARRGQETTGLTSTHIFYDPALIFLSYIAVRQDLRGEGLGGMLLDYTYRSGSSLIAKRSSAPVYMIWEVERVDPGLSEPERHRRLQRIEFFRRNGSSLLPYTYFQPPFEGGTPIPMHLMYCHAGPAVPEAAAVKRFVEAIYRERYGLLNGVSEDVMRQLLETSFR